MTMWKDPIVEETRALVNSSPRGRGETCMHSSNTCDTRSNATPPGWSIGWKRVPHPVPTSLRLRKLIVTLSTAFACLAPSTCSSPGMRGTVVRPT